MNDSLTSSFHKTLREFPLNIWSAGVSLPMYRPRPLPGILFPSHPCCTLLPSFTFTSASLPMRTFSWLCADTEELLPQCSQIKPRMLSRATEFWQRNTSAFALRRQSPGESGHGTDAWASSPGWVRTHHGTTLAWSVVSPHALDSNEPDSVLVRRGERREKRNQLFPPPKGANLKMFKSKQLRL